MVGNLIGARWVNGRKWCAPNPHGYYPDEHTTVPTADKPDF